MKKTNQNNRTTDAPRKGITQMIRRSPIVRISLALASLTIVSLFVAQFLGLIPDRDGAVIQGRKALCEAMAIQTSLAAQRGDFREMEAAMRAISRRNKDLLSAAVRNPDGAIMVEIGNHKGHWGNRATDDSTETHMKVPIATGDQLWGTVELCFRPLASTLLPASLYAPMLPLVAFVWLASFATYNLYLKQIFRGRDGAMSSSVPDRVRTTLDTLVEGVLVLDRNQRIALANGAFSQTVGLSPSQLQGRRVSELPWLRSRKNTPENEYPWEQALREGSPQIGRLLGLQNSSALHRTLSVNSTPICGHDGTHRGALATFDDVTSVEKKNAQLKKLLLKLKHSREEIRRQNEELRRLATRDPLTLCLNRRSFLEELESHWGAARRYGHALSCVMLDLDRFKWINDHYGHRAGDQVLQKIAEVLHSLVRKSDLVCRYGGEEFCILLPHTDIDQAFEAAERFRQRIEAEKFPNLVVTASLGVSALSQGAKEPTELLDQADQALYAAKRQGRNRAIRWDRLSENPLGESPPPPPTEQSSDAESELSIPFHAVTALISALAYRDIETAEHSRRVADLCVATARGLMSQSQCYVLEVAALLHDIGKLGVPDAILLKPGPLTTPERRLMHTHSRIGMEIVKGTFDSEELHDLVETHHAWYGGHPFDSDLPKGDEIPLGARILAIADAYDAMISDRTYRSARSREEAFAELRHWSGKQFDPELVERFIDVVLTRDQHRSPAVVSVPKKTALKIGLQIERLASALDDRDIPTIARMARRLKVTATEHGVPEMAKVTTQLEQYTDENADWAEILQLTSELLELCRSAQNSYLSNIYSSDIREAARMPDPVLASA